MLVGHWPLTESSGDAIDYAGANNGTVTGAMQGATGPLGYDCYSFDGVDDGVIGSPTGIGPGLGTSSTAFWFKTTSTSDDTVFSLVGSGSLGYSIRANRDGDNSRSGSFRFFYRDSSSSVLRGNTGSSIPTWTDGEWHHLVNVTDGPSNQIAAYLDGVEVTVTMDRQQGPYSFAEIESFYIGRGNSDYFECELFDVRYYDHRLTPAEVAALADVGSQAAYVSPKQQL